MDGVERAISSRRALSGDKVDESIEALQNVNRFTAGTSLPRVSQETIDAILHSNPFEHWWYGGYPG